MAPAGTASAEWAGFLTVERAGEYIFDITSDGETWLWINKTLAASDAGRHATEIVRGRITLPVGPGSSSGHCSPSV